MNRFFVLVLIFFAAAGASSPLSLRIETKRASLDLLDPVPIVISVINSSKAPVTAHFSSAQTYDIRVASVQGAELWRWSATHMSAQVLRTERFAPGKTTLATYIWGGTLDDGRSLAAGAYTLRVSLTDGTYHPSIEIPLRFDTPLPVRGALQLPLNAAATIAGTLRAKGNGFELVDSSGAIQLSKRIAGLNPEGTFIVRGYLTRENGDILLTVDRWARAFDNVARSSPLQWLQGAFGGRHASMTVSGTQGSLQFDCGHATFAALTPLDDLHASATGAFVREHGGPVRAGEILPSEPARFVFARTSGGGVVVTVTALNGHGIGTYALLKGAPPQLFRCL